MLVLVAVDPHDERRQGYPGVDTQNPQDGHDGVVPGRVDGA